MALVAGFLRVANYGPLAAVDTRCALSWGVLHFFTHRLDVDTEVRFLTSAPSVMTSTRSSYVTKTRAAEFWVQLYFHVAGGG